jgi:hypothetical protein
MLLTLVPPTSKRQQKASVQTQLRREELNNQVTRTCGRTVLGPAVGPMRTCEESHRPEIEIILSYCNIPKR